MKLSDVLDQLPADGAAGRVYGEPYETADGATVIPVAKPRGVFVVRGGRLLGARRRSQPDRADRGDQRSAGGGDRHPGGAPAAALAADHDHGE
jgi:hypothetical protein